MPNLVAIAELLRKMADELVGSEPESAEKEAALKSLDDKHRKYIKPPNEKPPRREKGLPLSETRDYGKDYMREYRAEGKDSHAYIPKKKKVDK